MDEEKPKIIFRTLVEVAGKPKEHVEQALRNYLEKLEQDELFKVLKKEVAPAKKHEESDLFAAFSELEIETDDVKRMVNFCFEYMPSLIEIIEPKQLMLGQLHISDLLNDLQARLHHVDMVAKQLKLENDSLKQNTGSMLKNYITVLLGKGDLTAKQLSSLTGISDENKLADFLDKLIDAGVIDLKEGVYHLKNGAVQKTS
jgi:hypothetical protein